MTESERDSERHGRWTTDRTESTEVALDTQNGDGPAGEDKRPVSGPTGSGDSRHAHVGFWELFLRHWHETMACCAAFWSFGMCVAFLGPTLLDLGCQTGSTMAEISWVFVVQLLCGLIGSILAGILVKRLDSYEVLVISTTLIPIFMLLIPFCSTLWSLVLALAAMGLYMGAVDCLATLNIIQTFEERVAPFLQLMFFCYGIGAFVSPMIAEPYLLNEDCSLVVAEQTNETTDLLPVVPGILFNNDSDVTEADSLQGARQLSGVSIAFWIMALMQTPVPFIVFSLVLKRRQGGWTRDHRKLVNSQSSDAVTSWARGDYENMDARTSVPKGDVPLSLVSKNCCTGAPSEVLFITFMAASLLFITEGLQSSFGGYVNSYAVQSIPQLHKPEGAYIDACFWGTFALGRLLSIFIATRYHPAHMLLASLVGMLGSTILMLALPHDRLAIYIGTCIFGLFLSSTSPTILSLTEQYIDLNMSTTTVLVVIAAFGEMFCPVVVGNMFANVGPGVLLVYGCVMCAGGLGVFIVLSISGRKTPKQKECGASNVWCECYCFPRRPTGECLVSAKWTANTYSCDDTNNLQLRRLAPAHDAQRDH